MKISMIGPVAPYRGGIAHFTTLLAKKLIEAGHEMQVISFKKQYPAWLYPGESDKDYSLGRETVDAVYLLTPLNPVSWWKTIRAVVAFQPEQVILPWWVTFWGLAFRHIITRLKRQGMTVTVLIHNTIPHEARFLDQHLAKQALQRGDRFIVMTQKEKGRLLALLPYAKNINVVAHPVYRMFKPTLLPKNEIRALMGLPIDKSILLFFGFVRPYKGLPDLLQALNIMIAMGVNVDLVIAGEFWDDREAHDQQIESLGITDIVHIFDNYIPDDQAAQFFEAADVFVAPYTDGTQSGALKAALGFGLPAVVTSVIADTLVLNLPEQCEIVSPRNPNELAKAIQKQLELPRLSKDRVAMLFEDSWKEMISVIAENAEKPNEKECS